MTLSTYVHKDQCYTISLSIFATLSLLCQPVCHSQHVCFFCVLGLTTELWEVRAIHFLTQWLINCFCWQGAKGWVLAFYKISQEADEKRCMVSTSHGKYWPFAQWLSVKSEQASVYHEASHNQKLRNVKILFKPVAQLLWSRVVKGMYGNLASNLTRALGKTAKKRKKEKKEKKKKMFLQVGVRWMLAGSNISDMYSCSDDEIGQWCLTPAHPHLSLLLLITCTFLATLIPLFWFGF